MQFPDLDLPPQPATDKWLRGTNSREDVVITVPLSVEEDGTPWVFGAIIFGNDAVTMIHNDFYSWNLFAEYSLEFDMNVYSDDLLQPEVGVIRSDAKNLKKIIKKFVEKILDDTGLGFPRYIDSPVGNNLKELREECDCKSISE